MRYWNDQNGVMHQVEGAGQQRFFWGDLFSCSSPHNPDPLILILSKKTYMVLFSSLTLPLDPLALDPTHPDFQKRIFFETPREEGKVNEGRFCTM